MSANLGPSLKYSTECEIPNIDITIQKGAKNIIALAKDCPERDKSLF